MTVFVFGSNEAGRHGKGAAAFARTYCGAIYGQGRGIQGQSYAIPTKDAQLQPLPLDVIQENVQQFLTFARDPKHRNVKFHVTRIGCGLAGYSDADIAPMFKDAPPNCELDVRWRKLLDGASFNG